MQLLPKTGKTVSQTSQTQGLQRPATLYPSREPGARHALLSKKWSTSITASSNTQLAAYNAGTDRVGDWRGQGHYRDPQEFVESIPFTETREYVQAILRMLNVYRQLYGTP